MAVYNTNTKSWTPFNYAVNQKTDYSGADFTSTYPNKTAADFASDYPGKTAADFASTYPANRATNLPTTQKFFVKFKSNGKVDEVRIQDNDPGTNWKSYTLRDGKQIGDYGFSFPDGDNDSRKTALLNARNQLDANNTTNVSNTAANNADIANRNTAATQYNTVTKPALQNTAATNYNTTQASNRNSAATQLNTQNQTIKNKNTAINNFSSSAISLASTTQGGDYLTKLKSLDDSVLRNAGLNSSEIADVFNTTKSSFDSFYLTEKVSPWDATTQGAKPPTGGFDVKYYETNYPGAAAEWNAAQAVNVNGRTFKNLDITARYDKNTYLLQHYTNVGRHAGYRANQALEAEQSTKYTETLTDYEKQLYRDQVLGITTQNGTDVIKLATPEYDADGKLLNEAELNTVLEQNIASTLTSESSRQEKQLQLLAQDVLQQSINELKKAKEKESNLMLMKNLPTYSEIMSINTTLSNSILGDSSFGGMLGFVDPKKTFKTQLEKDIAGLTGVSSNATVYNWQKWFDETLLKRYETFQLDLDDRTDEEINQYQEQVRRDKAEYDAALKVNPQAEKPLLMQKAEQYKLDINNKDQFKELLLKVDQDSQKEFLGSFINGYIKPRFDQSKSMDEFVSYLDVKEEEQNIFQSQSVINKLKQVAELRSNAMLSFYKTAEAAKKSFDSDFYLDPVAKATKELTSAEKLTYENQKAIVNTDFEAAKNGLSSNGVDWATEAYRYGYEGTYKTDPKAFAKLHYQVLGSTGQLKDAEGNSITLDPAENILGYNELQKKITEATEELVIRKDLYGDTAFMKFVTPEEFADSILQSVSPEKNKEEWEKILKQIGLEGEEATVENVKQYLIDSFRTEEAKNIRESIKYLNEQKETLNQEKLGVSYIEREADKKDISPEAETQLYQIFKSAGFEGSEDDFYTNFMPDVDREEQKTLSKALSKEGLTTEALDLSDPFSAFSNISSFFDQPEPTTTTTKAKDTSKSSYFNIFGGDEEELPTKSKAAQSILGEFTSMFKGFS